LGLTPRPTLCSQPDSTRSGRKGSSPSRMPEVSGMVSSRRNRLGRLTGRPGRFTGRAGGAQGGSADPLPIPAVSPTAPAGAGVRGVPRGRGVYVDAAIGEWQGLKWPPLLADDIDDLHRFAARLGIHRASYQGPPRTSVPHYDLTSYERQRAIALGATACSREEIVAVARRSRRALPQRP